MRVISCLNPQHIVNPYTHEHLTVRCGKCRSCRNQLAKRWIDKLEKERLCWKYCYFVTMTYADDNLPRLYSDGSCLYDPSDPTMRISFEELKFTTSKDFDYYNSRLHHRLGIPYARVSDVQKFNKRLNKTLHDRFTQKYQNFRYFVVSEYGKDTFRPHYHGLYFFSDRRIADNFEKVFSSCWSNGNRTKNRFDAVPVLGSATSYVAQYINMYADLPSIYQSGKLKPFYLFSKQPPIGSLAPLGSTISELFFSCSPTRIEYNRKCNKFSAVRHTHSFENRYYPKLPRYIEVPLRSRVELYRLVETTAGFDFKSFCYSLKERFTNPFASKHYKCSEHGKIVSSYVVWLTNNFHLSPSDYINKEDYECVINRLKRFYYISKRVCLQSQVFGISVFNYVMLIDSYYRNLERFNLRQFYEVQENYTHALHDVEDLAFMYQQSDRFFHDYQYEYVPQISETFAFKDIKATSDKIYNDSTKTHNKNDYLDRCRDKKLSLILKQFFNV